MAQAQVIAKVSSLSGEAFARDSSGKMRRLKVGDVIREGESVVSADGGQVILQLADGRTMTVRPGEVAKIDAEVGAPIKPDAADSSLVNNQKGFQKIAKAITGGGDLDSLLEQEAPAAGAVGTGGNEGHSFVEFLRVVETVDPLAFQFVAGAARSLPSFDQAPLATNIDVTAPALTARLDDSSDSGVKGDGITNDKTPTISGTGEPGATILVTMPGTGEKLTTTVKPDGSWTVTPGVDLPNGPGTVLVKETDPSGNVTEAKVPLVIDAEVPNNGAAPLVEITEDANNDGFINRQEAQGQTDVKVSFNGDWVSVGDVVQITSAGVTNSVVITAADKANGYVTTAFAPQASGTTTTVTAVIVDAAGNASTQGSDSAKVDLSTLEGLAVTITEDANNDGWINSAELQGTVGVRVDLPASAVAGDLLTLNATGSAAQTITLTQAQIDARNVVFEVAAPANGETLVVKAQVTDPAGNKSAEVSDSAVIDTQAPGAPVVEITEDGNNDGWINKAELNGDIGVTVSLAGTGAKAGETLLVSINGTAQTPIILTAADIQSGTVALTGISNPGEGVTLAVTAAVKDAAGNTGASGSDSATIDTIVPQTLTATLDPTSDSGTKGDNITNDKTPTISGTGDPGAKIEVTMPGTNEKLTTTVKPDGTWTVTPTQEVAEGPIVVNVKETDPAGNSISTTVPLTIDSGVPNDGTAPTVTITEDANNDGFINRVEAQGATDVKVSFNGNLVNVGDIVKITSAGVTKDVAITATDKANGFVTTDFPQQAAGTTVTATAVIVDAAGNTTQEGSDSAKLDLSTLDGLTVKITEDANDDGFINKAELQGTVGAEIKLPATAVAGDALTITATGNATQTIILTQAQIDAGKVIVELAAPGSGTEMVVTAQVKDPAGNESAVASDKATIATDDISAPKVTITEDSNNDGWINKTELNGDIGVSVELPGTAKAGDSLLVSVNGVARTPIVLTAADITAGNVAITGVTNPGEGSTLTVTAQVKDVANNLGAVGSDSAKIDTTTFSGLAISITEDENDDGFIGQAELKGNDIGVRVVLPAGAAVGDSLTVTGSGNVDKVITLTAAQLAAGFVDVTFNPTGNNTDFKATASIADPAGNKLGPVEDTARLQLSAPGAPIVTITEDGNNDGWINGTELNGTIDVSISVPATAKAGDKMLVTINGTDQAPIVLTQADIDKGSIAVPNVQNPGEGVTLTVTAAVKDAAGNTGATGSDSATIDTIAPQTLTATLDPTSDSGTKGDNITNDKTPTISGTGDPGAKIEVTMPTGEKLTTTVKPDGSWTVTPTQEVAEGPIVVNVKETDPAGNSISTTVPLTIDSGVPNNGSAPTVEITEDANNDGWINRAEAQGAADVKVSFNGNLVNVGDIVKITSAGVTNDVAITAADKANGFVTTTFPAQADGTTLTVTAIIVDAAGNSTAQGSDAAKVDITSYSGLAISITEDENNDAFISQSELKGNDIGVRVALPAGAAAGDTLTVEGSGNVAQTFVLTAAQLATGYIDVSFNPTGNNTDFVARASIVDAAGNSAGPVSDTARLQLTAPGAPIVTIAEDANNDGFINQAELNGPIDVSISVPATAKAGDSMLVTINGTPLAPIVLTQADIDKNSISIPNVSNPGEGNTLTVTAQVKDVAGNLGGLGSDSAKVDTRVPNGGVAPTVEISEDADNDGWINKAEAVGNADVKVSFDGTKVDVGDKVLVSSGGVTNTVTITAADKANNYVTTNFAQPADGSTMTVTAKIVDAALNSSAEGSDSAKVDTTVPNDGNAPVVTITEDANNDGFINRTEAVGNADVKVEFDGTKVDVGDKVLVSSGGVTNTVTITAADKTAGFVTTSFPPVAEGATMTVTAKIVDAAGNSTPDGSDSAKVDTTVPNDGNAPVVTITEDANNDGFINRTEAVGNADVKVEFDGTKVDVGDKVLVSSGGVTNTVTITAADKTAGFVTTSFPPVAEGATMTVTAKIVDAAGNSTPDGSDSAVLDTTPPNGGLAPTVTITEDANNDGFINRTEAVGNADVKVEFDGTKVDVGDKVLVSSGGVTNTVTITAADKTAGFVTTSFPPVAEGATMTVTAKIVDAAGNSTPDGSDSAVLDTTPPNGGLAPTVTITEDANNDGWINRTEAVGNADVRVSFDGTKVVVGDIVQVTSGGVTNNVAITATDKAAGFVTTSFPPVAEGATMTVTAVIVDAAGNATSAGSDSAKVDSSSPSLVITSSDGVLSPGELVTLTFTFSEQVKDFVAGDISVTGGTINPASLASADGGKTWTASFTQTGAASPVISVAAGSYTDLAGNSGSSASLTLNNAPDAIDDRYVLSSLKSQYWGYNEGTDGANLTTISQVETFANAHAATATFDLNNLNLGQTAIANNLGTAGNLATFLGGSATNLQTTAGYGTTSDAIVKMVGKINLTAGNYNFRVYADDGFVIRIDGVEVGKFDGIQSPTTREFASFNIATSGEHNIEIFYWDQAGNAVFKAELRPEGGAYQVLDVNSQYGASPLVTLEDKALTIEPATLLGNDKDQNGDPLQITSVQNATNGTVALVNGKVVFTPNPNYNGDATFTYTVSDGRGGSDTATVTLKVTPVADAPTIQSGVSATVSEEGLAGGLPDTTGAPTDTTNAKTATGTIAIADPDGDAISSVVLTVPTFATPLTSGGQTITWSGDNTGTLTATAGGQTVATISITNTGSYTVNLLKPIDHPAGQGENVLSFNVGVKATAGGQTTTGSFQVSVEDDSPAVVAPLTGNIAMTNTNLLITLDVSGSMGTADGVNGQTRLASSIASVKTLLDRYDEFGDVRVALVTFSTGSAQQGTTWLTVAQAKTYLDTLSAGGGTNYDAAINSAMTAFNTAGKLTNAQNVSYFFTDGVPTFGAGDTNSLTGTQNGTGGDSTHVDSGIQTGEEALWKTFLNNNQVKSFAIGMGSGITDVSYLNPIAYDGQGSIDTNGVRVTAFDQLDSVLAGTIQQPVGGQLVSGGLLGGSIGGDVGGYVASVLVGGLLYSYNVATGTAAAQTGGVFNTTTKEWTITTSAGGTFVVDMDGGTYSYKAPATLASTKVVETMNYTVSDRDGDTQSSTVTVNVERTNVVIGTTASETLNGTDQPDLILGRAGDDTINGGVGNDKLYGGDGNDTISGGLGFDLLGGGLGADTFKWGLADGGAAGAPVRDTIEDFTKGVGGDVLDLRDLLQGENSGNLTQYLHFSASGSDTLVQISSTGAFNGSNAGTVANQEILLKGVALSSIAGANASDAQIITELLKNNLRTD